MVRILNVFERTMALLASQFRDKKLNGEDTNFQKLIKALTRPLQELQDVFWELKTERWLSTAIGVQLDEIGVILGLSRNLNESDDDYRERLQFQIFINISSGTPEDIMRALQFLTQADNVAFFDVYPGFFQLETDGLNFPNPATDLVEGIFRISPAGVNYAPVTATLKEPIPLVMAGDFTSQLLYVVPDDQLPQDQANLLLDPYNALLSVNEGSTLEDGSEGALDELNHPQEYAGVISELIQMPV